MFTNFKKLLSKITAVSLVAILLFSSLFSPLTARAQVGGPVLVTSYPKLEIEMGIQKAQESFWEVAVSGVVQGVSYFLNKVAYDLAVGIATADKGQTPLIFQDPFGSYLENVASESFGTMLDEFGRKAGINFCAPSNEGVMLLLNIGIRNLYSPLNAPTPPACNWQKFKGNWAGFFEENSKAMNEWFGNPDFPIGVEVAFNQSLNIQDSDMGILLNGMRVITSRVSNDVTGAQAERQEGGGIKPVTDYITGEILTPATVVDKQFKAFSPADKAEMSASQATYIAAAGSTQALIYAGSVFVNTLVSSLINRVLQDGLFPPGPSDSTRNLVEGLPGNSGFSYRQQAEQAFSFFFTSSPRKQLYTFDPVVVFAACPDSPGLNNCVMDTQLQAAIDIARQGDALTIQEAIERGFLDGNKPLISPRRINDHADVKNCYQKGYCYSNIQKLRKLNILPLGFEIAALKADPDRPQDWTLGKVVSNFENCLRDQFGNVIPDPKYPFCHLIDPNWILRAPEARCENEVYTTALAGNLGGYRTSECVDVSTCVLEGPNGECLGSYGYCTQDKNVWRMGGDACPAHAASCKTYTARDNSLVSYLERSVDFGQCSPDDVGCRAYAALQIDGNWVSHQVASDPLMQVVGVQGTYYFNKEIEVNTCPEGAEGCNAFYQANPDGSYGQLVHLKKAPSYLGCYDTDLDTPEVEWAQSEAEVINLLNTNASCSDFSLACTASEVGCQGYSPLAGGPEIPGIIGANGCSAECVGYDTFRQDATVFAPTEFPLNFIPSRATSCSAEFAGCDEFTNLDTVSAGGEGLEYYTDLKYCEKPTGTNEKVFYTWEGSALEGFVLRRHNLLPVSADEANYINTVLVPADARAELAVVGSPAYADDSAEVLSDNFKKCNADSYSELINNGPILAQADPDCRAFFDDNGNAYYRLLADTVTVSVACHPLRKTESHTYVDGAINSAQLCSTKNGVWEDGACNRCYNGGRYEGGTCIYQTISLPGESNSCPAIANGCRAYVGNAGGNVREISFDDFEPSSDAPDALVQAAQNYSTDRGTDWGVVSEAAQVGLYSLRVNEQVLIRNYATGTFAVGSFYELSFWARSNQSQSLTIVMTQNGTAIGTFTANRSTGQAQPIGINDTWNQYTVGPVEFNGNPNQQVQIEFIHSTGLANSTYFIDKVRLTGSEEKIYLVKNSWKTPEGYDVPLSCDAAPTDGFPGTALGCSAYTDRNNATVYAVGFEKLCREDAIGCQPFIDTFNTVDVAQPELAHAYNVYCEGTAGQTCTILGDGGPANAITLGTCVPEIGETGCYVDEIIIPKGYKIPEAGYNTYIRPGTVIAPADTPTSSPIYLTARREFQCSEQQRGCMKLGLETQTIPGETETGFSYEDVFVLNDPALYTETLCNSDQLGCEEFDIDGNKKYFKDPEVIGNSICVYRDAGSTGVGESYGWFMNGIGQCAQDNSVLCRSNADCGTDTNGDEYACGNIGNVACYPNYVGQGGEYGLWSNESDSYAGFVGQCTRENHMCTEFIDPMDTANDPDGEAYYVKYNNKITDKIDECNGQASLKNGCVLFNQTDNPNKLYNAAATYEISENANNKFAPVDPITSGQLTTNILLKVDRDRTCSEWLACKTTIPGTDENGNRVPLCYEYELCNATEPGLGLSCTNYITDDLSDAGQALTNDAYVSRPTSWYDPEYTGFSLFNKYGVPDYEYVTFNLEGIQDKELVKQYQNKQFILYKMDPDVFGSPDDVSNEFRNAGCRLPSGISGTKDWQSCGFDGGGVCYSNSCYYPIEGRFPFFAQGTAREDVVESIFGQLTAGICKGYPEIDSPYTQDEALIRAGELLVNPSNPTESRSRLIERKPRYNGVNVCQDEACSCEYQKVTYNDGTTDYWSFGAAVPNGICQGGNNAGTPCSNDSMCSPGTCAPITEQQRRLGLRGYCLEKDFSRPLGNGEFACLTWLPIDVSASAIDLSNFYEEAGYYPPLDAVGSDGNYYGGGEVFCTEGTARGSAEVLDALVFRGVGVPGSQLNTTNQIDGITMQVNPNRSLKFSDFGFKERDSALDSPNGSVIETIKPFSLSNPLPTNSAASCPGASLIGCTLDDYLNPLSQCYFPFAYAVCTDSNTVATNTNLAGLMQLWAWKHLGTNVQLLRVETGISEGSADVSTNNREKWGLNEYVSTSDDELTVLDTWALFPTVIKDSMTFMHPPRFWDAVVRTHASNAFGYMFECASDKCRANEALNIRTDALSAAIYSVDGSSDKISSRVYTTDLSPILNEEQIDKVYFVPLRFPGIEQGGAAPGLLAKDFYIDVDDLLASDTHALVYDNVSQNDDKMDRTAHADGFSTFIQGPPEISTDHDDDGFVWTYMLERTSNASNCYGLLSHCTYGDDGYSMVAELSAQAGNTRNQVHRRYVAFFTSSEWIRDNAITDLAGIRSLLMSDGPRAPLSNYQNPFSATNFSCAANDDVSWQAIALDFNADGEFLGYMTRFCDGERPGSTGIQMAVFAGLKDQCREFTTVHDESDPAVGFNRAWTQRTWIDATDRSFPTTPFLTGLSQITQDAPKSKPYASTNLSASAVKSGSPILQNYVFDSGDTESPFKPGLPYSCRVKTALTSGGLAKYDTLFAANAWACRAITANPGESYSLSLSIQLSNYSQSVQSGFPALYNLFAKYYDVATVSSLPCNTANCGNAPVEVKSFDDLNPPYAIPHDTILGNPAYGVPPTVYAVNPETCLGAFGGNCDIDPAGKDNVTINSRNFNATADFDGDGFPDEDLDLDGEPDVYIGEGTFTAVMTFFAWADDNHMPIRRIAARWGDEAGGGQPTIMRSLYKNRKPKCVQADPANPRFGDSERGCQEGYYELVHTYSCAASDAGRDYAVLVSELTASEQKRLIDKGMSTSDFVCKFQPAVQVLDNWDWCNAEGVPAGGVYGGTFPYRCKTNIDSEFNGARYNGHIIVAPQRD